MQFCQLIDMRNTFIEKLIKSGAEASPRPFYKNSNLSMSLDQQSEMLYSLFYCLLYVQVETYQNILKLKFWPFAFTFNESFSAWFLKKNISHVVFY